MLLSVQIGYSQDCVEIETIQTGPNTIDLRMTNDIPVAGFHFLIVNFLEGGITNIDVYGGSSEALGFFITDRAI